MLPVSTEFLEAIKADTRRIKAKIEVTWIDQIIDESIIVTASENARVSWPQQAADEIETIAYKWASCEGSTIVDGSFHPCPDSESLAFFHQMGWWGGQVARADGSFAVPHPTLTVSFLARPVVALKVVGDDARGEYPVDFEVRVYDGDTLKYSQTITGNESVNWQEGASVNSATRIELEVLRWSHPGRQAKISEFLTAVKVLYYEDDIGYIGVLEERDISNGSLPIGNISANEVDIKLNNIDNRYSAGNIESPFAPLIRPNRKVRIWLGAKLPNGKKEYVPMGTYWTEDWQGEEDDVYISTSARDRMEMLKKSTFSGEVYQNKTLHELAEIVLLDAQQTVGELFEYWIDPELEEYLVPWAYFDSMTHRNALRLIVEACCGQAYVDRNDVVRVEGPSFITTGSPHDITKDDYFTKNQPEKSGELANVIKVYTNPLQPTDTPEEVYRSQDVLSVESGNSRAITVFYNKNPVIDASVTLEEAGPGLSISEVAYYAWGANIKITNAGESTQTCKVVATGRPLEVQGQQLITAQDDLSIRENGLMEYKFPNNQLVQTPQMAEKIASNLLAFAIPRRDVELDWRGNPALTLADVVRVPEYQRGSVDKRGLFYITKQRFEYDGALRVNTEGRKIDE